MDNYNNNIRLYIEGLVNYIDAYTEYYQFNKHEIYTRNFSLINNLKNSLYNKKDTTSLLFQKSMFILSSTVLINDLYISLNYLIKSGEANTNETLLFTKVKKAVLEKNTDIIDSSRYIEEFIQASIDFLYLTNYEKITLIKALDEEDVLALSNFNPMFLEEYNLYNIALTKEFLKEEITFLLNDYKDAYLDTAWFLINLFKADEDKVNDIIFEMIDTDEDALKIADDLIDENTEELIKYIKRIIPLENQEILKK